MLKEFKRSLHLKLAKEEIKEYKNYSKIETLCYCFGFNPVSNEYCISNYEMAADFEYNGGYAYYRVTFGQLEDLKNGKMIILHKLPQKYVNEYILNDEY